MRTSETTAALAKALSEFQAAVGNIPKTATNPHFKSAYAPLDEIVAVINQMAPAHNLSHIQSVETRDGGPAVVTRIMHTSGEWIETDPLVLPPDKATAQGNGSAITYARRYQLPGLFGLATEDDDDGNAATHTAPERSPNSTVATEQQIKTIWAVSKSVGWDKEKLYASLENRFGEGAHPDKLTRQQASAVIDGLKELEKQQEAS